MIGAAGRVVYAEPRSGAARSLAQLYGIHGIGIHRVVLCGLFQYGGRHLLVDDYLPIGET
jgi:hypothetical protein